MSVLAPPPQDELELLIREARARQRRRRLIGAVALIAVVAGTALGVDSIVGGIASSSPVGGPNAAAKSGAACGGVRVAWTKILDRDGHVLYREPIPRTMGHQLQCSGSNLWVVFYNGVGMSQQAYFGVHSGDGGRTWRPVFTESYFGLRAPHQLVVGYLGPWTIAGSAAYFTGWCPACREGTNELWVTTDGGRKFRRYAMPALNGYEATGIQLNGDRVIVSVRRSINGALRPKTVAVQVS